MTDYSEMNTQLAAVTEGVDELISNLSNAAAVLWTNFDRINWAGFYIMRDNRLILGPFQGKIACTTIQIGKGVCGTAVQKKQTIIVPNVHEFPGHIACDSHSNSEIVVPIIKNGDVLGVIDIDSTEFGRFTDADRQGLEQFADIIANCFGH